MLPNTLLAGLFLATATRAIPTASHRDDQGVVRFKRGDVLSARDFELAEMHGVNLTESKSPRGIATTSSITDSSCPVYKHSVFKRDDGDHITIWVDNGFQEAEGPQEDPLSKRQTARLWFSHHYTAANGRATDYCRQHDRRDWTSAGAPFTGGVRAIAEWARDNRGWFNWGVAGGGWGWRTVLIGGSNSGSNARYRGQVIDDNPFAAGTQVGTDDVRDDAYWTLDRQRQFNGRWRAASYGWETCGVPGPANVRFNYEIRDFNERV